MRRGVFGGSFDPVHIGHLIAAEAAADCLALEEVRFVPTCVQPFKSGVHCTPADRVEMLRTALSGNRRFVLDEREIERGGVSYTVETLESLRDEFPGDELFLLVGADAAQGLGAWRQVKRVAALATIVELTRPGAPASKGSRISQSVHVPAIDVSATAVREAVQSGRSIRYLVPAVVAEYIAQHALYRIED